MDEKILFMQTLTDRFSAIGLSVSETQKERFYQYFAFLREKNKVMNLTGITDIEGVVGRHFADSLLPLLSGDVKPGDRCVDVGSGAGFPGLPLAIMMPDCTFLLMDSLGKRIDFLNETVALLELTNVSTLLSRAETAGKGDLRERFDVVLSRAVSPMNVLCEYCLPLCKVGGRMVALKSTAARDEMTAAQKAILTLGGSEPTVFGTDERNTVTVVKTSPTPSGYPRREGVPEKRPL